MSNRIALSLTPMLVVLVGVPSTGSANKSRQTRRDIQRLAGAVRAKARTARLPQPELAKARWHLSRALAILGQGGSTKTTPRAGDYAACVEFAYRGYARSHTHAIARRRATERCKAWRLLEVARLLFRAYTKSYAPPTAMDLALDRSANRKLRNKTALLRYAIAGYSKSYAASTAVERAVTEAAKLRPAGLPCVRRAYSAHVRKHPAFTALDKAFAHCQQRFAESSR